MEQLLHYVWKCRTISINICKVLKISALTFFMLIN